MRVAVVGAGLGGLAAAHELARSGGVRVTLYEEDYLRGGAKTVAIDVGTDRVLVDLGFMDFNPVRNEHLFISRIWPDFLSVPLSHPTGCGLCMYSGRPLVAACACSPAVSAQRKWPDCTGLPKFWASKS
jgi:predicted NAD/FAD-binding protein